MLEEQVVSVFGSFGVWVVVIVAAMLPLIEARSAIPLGCAVGVWGAGAMSPWVAAAVAFVASSVAGATVILLLPPVLKWLRKRPKLGAFARILDNFFARKVDQLFVKKSRQRVKLGSAKKPPGEGASGTSLAVGNPPSKNISAANREYCVDGNRVLSGKNWDKTGSAGKNADNIKEKEQRAGNRVLSGESWDKTSSAGKNSDDIKEKEQRDGSLGRVHRQNKKPKVKKTKSNPQSSENSTAKNLSKGVFLSLLVAAPVPLLGVYSGAGIGVFMGLKWWQNMLSVLSGNLISCLLIVLLCVLFTEFIELFLTCVLIVAALVLLWSVINIIYDAVQKARIKNSAKDAKTKVS